MGAIIVCLVVFGMVAAIMFGLGILQLRTKPPRVVTFYTGEKPILAKELTDVEAWNRKHGQMWILYGVLILLSFSLAAIDGMDSLWSGLLLGAGVLAPLPCMVGYHHYLIRRYRVKKEDGTDGAGNTEG